MASQKAFGRRAGTQPPSRAARTSAASATPGFVAVADEAPAERMVLPSVADFPAHDHELEDWKRSRKFQIPWRQLSFMASLCFGVASFVLPASVNDKVDWLLYALMAISFIAGLSRRRKAKS
ncbi:MAG TPA: hypothetical protein VL971_10095 [Rhizomicrobium sp.]|nr:hypothetical protein [Rhizomicrobium sp.]